MCCYTKKKLCCFHLIPFMRFHNIFCWLMLYQEDLVIASSCVIIGFYKSNLPSQSLWNVTAMNRKTPLFTVQSNGCSLYAFCSCGWSAEAVSQMFYIINHCINLLTKNFMISLSVVYVYAFFANQDVLTENQVNIQKCYLFID